MISKVSKKGLTNIPVKVRKALNIEEGDLLIWKVDKEQSVVIIRVVKNPIKYLRGKYNDPELTYDKVEKISEALLIRELHANN